MKPSDDSDRNFRWEPNRFVEDTPMKGQNIQFGPFLEVWRAVYPLFLGAAAGLIVAWFGF